jgi:hypothetical protein
MSIPRRLAAAILVLAVPGFATAARYTTTNFVVDAPTPELAKQYGDAAERFRVLKAREWLGQEMPNWAQPCPLKVEITAEAPSGATTFDFGRQPLYQFMQIRGPHDRLLNSVLPHEITHTVFAHYFRSPVPRWADEGGAVLSEDDQERENHDRMCRQLLNAGRAMQLRVLFGLKEYPKDVMVVYAQGFSVVRFLVQSSDRQTFLRFVGQGMRRGWEEAVHTHYGYNSVAELEKAWIESLRRPQRREIASADAGRGTPSPVAAAPVGRSVTRTTIPPSQPEMAMAPTFRGTSARSGDEGDRFRDIGRPTHLPDVVPAAAAPPPPPLNDPPPPPPLILPDVPIRLGPPQFLPPPPR